jgi:hypothetical protein
MLCCLSSLKRRFPNPDAVATIADEMGSEEVPTYAADTNIALRRCRCARRPVRCAAATPATDPHYCCTVLTIFFAALLCTYPLLASPTATVERCSRIIPASARPFRPGRVPGLLNLARDLPLRHRRRGRHYPRAGAQFQHHHPRRFRRGGRLRALRASTPPRRRFHVYPLQKPTAAGCEIFVN